MLGKKEREFRADIFVCALRASESRTSAAVYFILFVSSFYPKLGLLPQEVRRQCNQSPATCSASLRRLGLCEREREEGGVEHAAAPRRGEGEKETKKSRNLMRHLLYFSPLFFIFCLRNIVLSPSSPLMRPPPHHHHHQTQKIGAHINAAPNKAA